MFKDIKISYAPINKKLSVLALDILSIIVGFVALYFILLFSVFYTTTNYSTNRAYVNETETALRLNLGEDKEYSDYEDANKKFYFETYPNEIIEHYSKVYNEELSLIHFYNITVLSLPYEPVAANHSNQVFTYRQNEDGTYNPDVEGVFLFEEGERSSYFYKNARDIYYNAYTNLSVLLMNFDEQYKNAINENSMYDSLCRLSAGAASIVIFSIIIPFTNKKHLTLFQRIFNVAQVNYNSLYYIPWYKVLLRPILYYLIPLAFIVISGQPTFVIFAIFYLFINMLTIILREDKRDLVEKILSMQTIDLNDSLIFDTYKEEKEYIESDEYKKITDNDFLDKLSSIETLNFSSMEDKKLINKKRKEKV